MLEAPTLTSNLFDTPMQLEYFQIWLTKLAQCVSKRVVNGLRAMRVRVGWVEGEMYGTHTLSLSHTHTLTHPPSRDGVTHTHTHSPPPGMGWSTASRASTWSSP